MPPKRSLLLATLAISSLAGTASDTLASNVAQSGSTLQYTATAGETNNVSITLANGTFYVVDAGASITTGTGCSAGADVNHVTCSSVGITSVSIDVHDLSNSAAVDIGTMPSLITASNASGIDTFHGGDGSDTLLGLSGGDSLHGGGGDDLLGGDGQSSGVAQDAGNDQMFGDGGNDTFFWVPGDGDDLLEGGGGTDTANMSGNAGAEQFSASLISGRARIQRVQAAIDLDLGDVERFDLRAFAGADTVTVNSGLAGLLAVNADLGAATDTFNGAEGNETVIANDGEADTVNCGAGDDTVTSDPIDVVNADCLNDEPPPSGGGGGSNTPLPDKQAAIATLGGKTKQKIGKQGGAILVDVTYNEAVTVAASAGVSVPGASKTLKFKSLTKSVAANVKTTLKLKLSKSNLSKVKRALKKGKKLKAKITLKATDAAGNAGSATRTVRLAS